MKNKKDKPKNRLGWKANNLKKYKELKIEVEVTKYLFGHLEKYHVK